MTWRHFTEAEMRCRETGECRMDDAFMAKLDELREAFGKPLTVTSGFRSAAHSIERKKDRPGVHTTGTACDFGVSGADAYRLMFLAMQMGFRGIGVQQKGTGRFVHVDMAPDAPGQPRPTVWSY